MKINFSALFLTTFPLCASFFCLEARCETSQPTKTVVYSFQQSNLSAKEIQFLSNKVLWNVNRRAGSIQALDPDVFSPLWSSSGVVYRTSLNSNSIITKERTSNVESVCPIFGESIEFTEISGRVYFHLSEQNKITSLPSSRDYTDQILAFDPNSQGKLLWKLKASELLKLLRVSSNAVPRFAAAPLRGNDNVLLLLLVLDSQTICVKIDARFGMPIVD